MNTTEKKIHQQVKYRLKKALALKGAEGWRADVLARQSAQLLLNLYYPKFDEALRAGALSTLMEATRVKPKRGETENQWKSRLVTAIMALDDDAWVALGEPAQDRANDMINAKKNGKKII